ncbi:MAG: ROK family protein [Clostridia bacterium]|nr:ROK family protein [Clostridia bacterium]
MKIGIDLGGSHIAIGLVEEEKILKKIEYNFTEQDKNNLEEIIKKIIKNAFSTIFENVSLTEITMVGISVPGRTKDGCIKEAANIKAKNINIVKMVEEILDKPVYIMNDGMCAGIAEKEYGSLKNYRNGVFLGLGTGVGTAVFIKNKLVPEVRSAGHMIIEKNGRKCNCGKNGCYETYASMKALKTMLRQRLGQENLSSKEILEELKNPEKIVQVEDIIKEYIEYVAIGVSNFARMCSAQVIVIGGSFVHYKDILFNPLLKELDRIMIPMEKEMVDIKLATLGNDAGIIGATKIDKYSD